MGACDAVQRLQDGHFRFTDPATGQDTLLEHSPPSLRPSERLTSSVDDQRSVWQEAQEGTDVDALPGSDPGNEGIATELVQADFGAFPNPPQVEQAAEESSQVSMPPRSYAVNPEHS